MEVTTFCHSSVLQNVFSVMKRIMIFVQIIVPILLIVFGTISFIKLVYNPDEKHGMNRVLHQFIAAIIVFFVPVIVEAMMSILDNHTEFSRCWNSANDLISAESVYYDLYGDRKKILPNAKDYEVSSHTGLEIAKLALRVVPIATPQASIHTPKSNENGGAWCKRKDERLYDYFKIMDAVIGKYPSHDDSNRSRKQGINNNNAYASCEQAVAGIIRAAADPDFESGSPELGLDYLNQNEAKWQLITRLKTGTRYDSICELGDLIILEGFSNHYMIYLGNDLVRTRFPKSNGDMYEASYSEDRYPTITHHEVAYGTYARVYRFTGQGQFYYPFIDIEATLSGNVDFNKQMC